MAMFKKTPIFIKGVAGKLFVTIPPFCFTVTTACLERFPVYLCTSKTLFFKKSYLKGFQIKKEKI